MNSMFNKIFSKSLTFSLNYRIVAPIIFLCLISLLLLNSTSQESSFYQSTFNKQLLWLVVGIFIFSVVQYIRIQFFNEYAYHFYFILILAILSTFFMPAKGGAQRWIDMGLFSVQPSEIGKILMVFVLSRFLSDRRESSNHFRTLLFTLLLALIPALMV